MIKAVMFDMGGTLEDLYSDEKNDRATAYALYDIYKSIRLRFPTEPRIFGRSWARASRRTKDSPSAR